MTRHSSEIDDCNARVRTQQLWEARMERANAARLERAKARVRAMEFAGVKPLKRYSPAPDVPPGVMRSIVEAVAARFNLSLDALMAPTRSAQPTALARQEAYRQCRAAGASLPKIGRFFGRDHTTVLHGIRMAEARNREQHNGAA